VLTATIFASYETQHSINIFEYKQERYGKNEIKTKPEARRTKHATVRKKKKENKKERKKTIHNEN
jgi:hypothetical protein